MCRYMVEAARANITAERLLLRGLLPTHSPYVFWPGGNMPRNNCVADSESTFTGPELQVVFLFRRLYFITPCGLFYTC